MSRLIAGCWERIRRTDPALLHHPLWPLAHLDPCLHDFGLPPLDLEETRTTAELASTLQAASPSFKALTDDILLALRLQIAEEGASPLAESWAEKLLRFVELRRRALRSRALAKCGSSAAARRHLLHLACFLMDHAAFSHDARFLNTALKLADMSWLLRRSALERNLGARDEAFILALFQFRLVLMTEWGVARLRREGSP